MTSTSARIRKKMGKIDGSRGFMGAPPIRGRRRRLYIYFGYRCRLRDNVRKLVPSWYGKKRNLKWEMVWFDRGYISHNCHSEKPSAWYIR